MAIDLARVVAGISGVVGAGNVGRFGAEIQTVREDDNNELNETKVLDDEPLPPTGQEGGALAGKVTASMFGASQSDIDSALVKIATSIVGADPSDFDSAAPSEIGGSLVGPGHSDFDLLR